MIDTLRLFHRLTEAGMERAQAEALVEELDKALHDNVVTKPDLDAALGHLKVELIRWQVGIAFVLFGALQLLHH